MLFITIALLSHYFFQRVHYLIQPRLQPHQLRPKTMSDKQGEHWAKKEKPSYEMVGSGQWGGGEKMPQVFLYGTQLPFSLWIQGVMLICYFVSKSRSYLLFFFSTMYIYDLYISCSPKQYTASLYSSNQVYNEVLTKVM